MPVITHRKYLYFDVDVHRFVVYSLTLLKFFVCSMCLLYKAVTDGFHK